METHGLAARAAASFLICELLSPYRLVVDYLILYSYREAISGADHEHSVPDSTRHPAVLFRSARRRICPRRSYLCPDWRGDRPGATLWRRCDSDQGDHVPDRPRLADVPVSRFCLCVARRSA